MKIDGSQAALNAAVLAELARLVAAGELEVPIAATFPLGDVRDAFQLLEQRPHPGQDRASALSALHEMEEAASICFLTPRPPCSPRFLVRA